ncbi:hypothetical protein [Lacticaseibacillus parakribbianus]|uniref:hypothetical protein n=1 Tax=Lacticaseibacillus parakribbianus TaxID=2970927 RepID=UPI0021CB47AB|nr:hypothetical protein [Lacticaseibacillus parakribbianus]
MSNHHLRYFLEIITMLTICAFAWLALAPQTATTAHYRLDAGRITYDGRAFKGQFSGQGTLRFQNGDRYVGRFKAGRFNGRGRFTSHAGWRYVGHFKAGQVTGTGSLTTAQHTYRGTFKNGQFTRTQAPSD